MAALSDMLIGLVKPALSRALVALGFASVTVAGVDTSIQYVRTFFDTSVASFDPVILNLMGVAGVWKGLGIIFGAVSFAVSYWTLTRSVRILGLVGA